MNSHENHFTFNHVSAQGSHSSHTLGTASKDVTEIHLDDLTMTDDKVKRFAKWCREETRRKVMEDKVENNQSNRRDGTG
jgi:hypothetical protein